MISILGYIYRRFIPAIRILLVYVEDQFYEHTNEIPNFWNYANEMIFFGREKQWRKLLFNLFIYFKWFDRLCESHLRSLNDNRANHAKSMKKLPSPLDYARFFMV